MVGLNLVGCCLLATMSADFGFCAFQVSGLYVIDHADHGNKENIRGDNKPSNHMVHYDCQKPRLHLLAPMMAAASCISHRTALDSVARAWDDVRAFFGEKYGEDI